MAGTVEAICIASTEHGRQERLTQANIVAGAGLVGDRYFGARPRDSGQNVTVVELEEIERFKRETGENIGIDATRRNIVTRGIRLDALVGREFTIGNVRLRGVELCEPCRVLGDNLKSETLSAADVVRRFVHRAGLRADALSDGTIKVGDPIVEVDAGS